MFQLILFFHKLQCYCISVVIDCGDPGTPSNGIRTGSVFTFGGTVRYRCNQGYILSGASTRTCEASGRWSGTEAVCSLRGRRSFRKKHFTYYLALCKLS